MRADMVEECGRVVAVEPAGVWVSTLSRTGCGRCDEPGGCGRQSIFRLFGQRRHHVLARLVAGETDAAAMTLAPGDPVSVGIPEGLLLRASLVLYLLPLLALLAGALAGQALGGELASIGLGLAGVAGGFLLARSLCRRHLHQEDWQPVVLRRLSPAAGRVLPS